MKLVIQIPCFNEEEQLPVTLSTIPKHIEGIDSIELLIIDDGSTDRTVEVARQWAIANNFPLQIAHHTRNRGLAVAFQTGLNTALAMGADIIVNTDADNQYPSESIPDLIRPIQLKQLDLVIADRQTQSIEHFSPIKKFLQKVGSYTVSIFSGSKVTDAVSGFRAMSRETALTLNVITNYTYTVETIFQASKRNLAIGSIPIFTNPKTRDSRLVKSVWGYVKRMGATMVRIYAMHEPLKAFFYFSIPFFLVGGFYIFRFLILSIIERNIGARFIQSVILGGVSVMLGVVLIMIGLLADLISRNRRLIEDSLFRVKRIELDMIKQREREEDLLAEIKALRTDLKVEPSSPNSLKSGSHHHLTQVEEIIIEDVVPGKS
ncbi:glycosyltransferase [Candidatus Chlorohelix sp.]|uniref:glycosyltransferase n=1 Tax=Candidatus Chlorohelix sp. TaxID=3139201 RepID=UPI003020DD48